MGLSQEPLWDCAHLCAPTLYLPVSSPHNSHISTSSRKPSLTPSLEYKGLLCPGSTLCTALALSSVYCLYASFRKCTGFPQRKRGNGCCASPDLPQSQAHNTCSITGLGDVSSERAGFCIDWGLRTSESIRADYISGESVS